MSVDFDSLEEAILWIMDWYFSKKIKWLKYRFGLLQTWRFSFTSHQLMEWSCMDYDLSISWMDVHSDSTRSLQRIHWWASDVGQRLLKICSDEETNFSAIFLFWVNYSLNDLLEKQNDKPIVMVTIGFLSILWFQNPPYSALGNPEARENTDYHSFEKPALRSRQLCCSLCFLSTQLT